jgi:hypothetical protein
VLRLLLLAGAIGAAGFVLVFTVDGATRPGYRPVRDPVSALALGPRGRVQTLNFVLGGALLAGGGGALVPTAWPLGIGTVMLGLGLVASGVYRMDPMRGYPPGTSDGDPPTLSRAHRLHDAVGGVVFLLLPVLPIVAALSGALPGPLRVLSGVVALVAVVGVAWFTRAWESASPRAGLAQRLPLGTTLLWLAGVQVVVALT